MTGTGMLEMDWYDATEKYHVLTPEGNGELSSLPHVWQRELAALWRLEADVNNGAYLQFLANWGRETYEYASQALKKIGAHQMAEIIDRCQALVDEHFLCEGKSFAELSRLMPNAIFDCDGRWVKEAGSVLPESVVERIYALSYEFIAYPENVAELGMRHYGLFLAGDSA
jgi:hypothetical protein